VNFCGGYISGPPALYKNSDGEIVAFCIPPTELKGYIGPGAIWEVLEELEERTVDCQPVPEYSSYKLEDVLASVLDFLEFYRRRGRAPKYVDPYVLASSYLYRARGFANDDQAVLNYFYILMPKTYWSDDRDFLLALDVLATVWGARRSEEPEFVVTKEVEKYLGSSRYIVYLSERGVFDGRRTSLYKLAKKHGYVYMSSTQGRGHALLMKKSVFKREA